MYPISVGRKTLSVGKRNRLWCTIQETDGFVLDYNGLEHVGNYDRVVGLFYTFIGKGRFGASFLERRTG
jgi:hypothetical protein